MERVAPDSPGRAAYVADRQFRYAPSPPPGFGCSKSKHRAHVPRQKSLTRINVPCPRTVGVRNGVGRLASFQSIRGDSLMHCGGPSAGGVRAKPYNCERALKFEQISGESTRMPHHHKSAVSVCAQVIAIAAPDPPRTPMRGHSLTRGYGGVTPVLSRCSARAAPYTSRAASRFIRKIPRPATRSGQLER